MQGSICLRISDQELDLSKMDDKIGIHNTKMILKDQKLHGNRTLELDEAVERWKKEHGEKNI